jgi:hypothetical protein
MISIKDQVQLRGLLIQPLPKQLLQLFNASSAGTHFLNGISSSKKFIILVVLGLT